MTATNGVSVREWFLGRILDNLEKENKHASNRVILYLIFECIRKREINFNEKSGVHTTKNATTKPAIVSTRNKQTTHNQFGNTKLHRIKNNS